MWEIMSEDPLSQCDESFGPRCRVSGDCRWYCIVLFSLTQDQGNIRRRLQQPQEKRFVVDFAQLNSNPYG